MIDLLEAIRVVSDAANQLRRDIREHYGQGEWRRVRRAKSKKEQLRDLQDRGIVEAVRENRLRFVKKRGGLAVYAGEGHCFVSTLLLDGPLPPSERYIWMLYEEDTAERRSTRLTDAIRTLEQLPKAEGFRRLPSRATSKRSSRNSA